MRFTSLLVTSHYLLLRELERADACHHDVVVHDNYTWCYDQRDKCLSRIYGTWCRCHAVLISCVNEKRLSASPTPSPALTNLVCNLSISNIFLYKIPHLLLRVVAKSILLVFCRDCLFKKKSFMKVRE